MNLRQLFWNGTPISRFGKKKKKGGDLRTSGYPKHFLAADPLEPPKPEGEGFGEWSTTHWRCYWKTTRDRLTTGKGRAGRSSVDRAGADFLIPPGRRVRILGRAAISFGSLPPNSFAHPLRALGADRIHSVLPRTGGKIGRQLPRRWPGILGAKRSRFWTSIRTSFTKTILLGLLVGFRRRWNRTAVLKFFFSFSFSTCSFHGNIMRSAFADLRRLDDEQYGRRGGSGQGERPTYILTMLARHWAAEAYGGGCSRSSPEQG